MNKIILFAHLREELGTSELFLEAEGRTVKELKEILRESYSFNETEHVMIAINEEFAQDEQVIRTGDVIAFIPPVSGG